MATPSLPSSSRFDPASDLAALDDRFVIVESSLVVAGVDVTIEHPRSADDLINEADFDKDERLPYWADVWPSSTALAAVVAALDGAGQRALELGCGLGLVTIAALRAGFDVVATDYYDDALRFARRNALGNAQRAPQTRMVDWRDFPADLGTFDLVLASDVLYESHYAPLIAGALDATLAPGGRALVADPGRLAVPDFLAACAARG
ncbi:MAG: class I SAM-dependent methyltransferase, partial [Gemmatimonadetes bacterium]|nr:class I SAM-dependent methyltransferase [Gemmatimonadota bacterium]